MAKSRKKVFAKAETIAALPKGYKAVLETIVDKIKAAQTRAR